MTLDGEEVFEAYSSLNSVNIPKDPVRTSRLRQPSVLAWESESGEQRSSRRSRLRELDHILEALEELNLDGQRTVPAAIRRHLFDRGIVSLPGDTPSTTLERVLLGQETYLLHPAPEPTPKPLRRSRRPPIAPIV